MIWDLFLIGKLIILLLLLYGTVSDVRFYYVSNKVSYSIGGLALLMFNPQVLELKTVFIMFLFASWYIGNKYHFNLIGSADVKILIPLILMLASTQFLAFMIAFSTIGMGIGFLKKDIPGFVPITIAFIIATFIIN